jgi:hypothetical protein
MLQLGTARVIGSSRAPTLAEQSLSINPGRIEVSAILY